MPKLLVAQLLPGLIAMPFIGRLVPTREAGRRLTVTALIDAIVIAWMAWHPDLATTILGASVLSASFAVGGAASFVLIPVLAARLEMTLPRAKAVLKFVCSAGLQYLTWSLHGSTNDLPKSLTPDAREVKSATEETKRLLSVDCARADTAPDYAAPVCAEQFGLAYRWGTKRN